MPLRIGALGLCTADTIGTNSAMTTRTRAVHVPAAGYDVFGAMPCTPLCTLAPPFPYGLKAHCLRLSDITYSAGLPAFDEDSVSIQLRHSTMMHTTLDRTYRVVTQPGDALIIPRTLPAHFDNEVTGDSDILIVSLPLHLWQKIAALDLDGYGRPIELRPFAAEDHDPLLHGLGWALYQQMLQPANRNQLYLESLANTLALHLVQRYAIAKPRLLAGGKSLPPAVVRRVCDYIEANLGRELTLQDLAAVAQYSPYHLTRRFAAATGQPLHQYVTARRVAKAKSLLETTDLTLEHIAQIVGFADQSHLSRQFRRAYGCAPGALRSGGPEAKPGRLT